MCERLKVLHAWSSETRRRMFGRLSPLRVDLVALMAAVPAGVTETRPIRHDTTRTTIPRRDVRWSWSHSRILAVIGVAPPRPAAPRERPTMELFLIACGQSK